MRLHGILNADVQMPILPERISPDGWLEPGRRCPSPNFNERPDATVVDLLVIHNISLPPDRFGGRYIEEFFCNQLNFAEHPYFSTIAGLRVSAHCLIDRDGEVTQFVSFRDRAWHAGRSTFAGRSECNDFSIGIELEGADHTPYTDAQYHSLTEITRLLLKQYPALTGEHIVGHCDIAPARKTDPGPAFDWRRYRQLLDQSR